MINKTMAKRIFVFLILILISISLIVLGFSIFNFRKTEKVKAQADGQNVWGWAWSETIGWISFNNTSGGGTVDYGVNIEADGSLTGYAWSENIGWIKFNPGPDFASGLYPEGPQYPAKLDTATNEFSGWARACAGTINGDCNSATRTDGWDGWIKLKGTTTNGSSYGVTLNTTPDPNEFEGWAWGSDVVGWISFNNATGGGTVDYKVMTSLAIIQPPTVSNPQRSITYCGVAPGVGRVDFRWTYTDEPENTNQAAYRLEVERISPSPAVLVNCEMNTAFPPSGGQGAAVIAIVEGPTAETGCESLYYGSVGPFIGDINYNAQFRWRVSVKDGDGNWSTPTDWQTFSIDPHAYPYVDFSWAPQSPSVDQIVQFADQSKCYDAAGNVVPCASWLWEFLDYSCVLPPFECETVQNPQIKFTSIGEKKIVTLTVTDSDFSCPGSQDVSVTLPLPEWREIAPF